jgi:hypothetical protein
VSAAATLETLRGHGYQASLENTELVVRGPGPVPEPLRGEIVSDTVGVKTAVLLSDPPAWLEKLFEMWWDGTETPVSLSAPSGKAETYMVRVTVKQIATATAAKIGLDPLKWEMIREEVEEALGSWKGA